MSETPDPEVVELATKVFDLARAGETEALTAYVEAGVPANLTNDRGDTLVMLAAYHGHAATVAALVARDADPDRANDRGQTPLAGAVFKGEDAVVDALLAVRLTRPPERRPRWTRPGCSASPTCWNASVRGETTAGAPLEASAVGFADRSVVNVVAVAKWLGHHDVAGPLRATDERQRKMLYTRRKTAVGRSCHCAA